MDNQLFVIDGYVTKISTMSKNCLRIQIDTQENVSSEAAGRVFGWLDQLGHFLFAIRQLQPQDLLDLPISEPEFKEEKSPSKRMKAVLYRLWEQKKEGYEDFELFYRFKMEKLIEVLKNKLEA
jgi:hypothetical protein